VISAHWEEPEFTVTSGAKPPLIYDYYGFPDHTYQLRYDAPGSPKLAEEIRTLLAKAGIASQTNSERGFDHGVFIPFKLIYPNAVIPIVQLSLKTGLDPAAHIAAGRAIAPLRDRNILIVGSGMSFHNMATMMRGTPTEARDELRELWSEAPGARVAHPREEHLIPLMVAAGAAGPDRGHRTFHGHVMNATVSGFQFGG
jgi:aromatic ring-opening dioxygenase catalytic subunit (LigB family)